LAFDQTLPELKTNKRRKTEGKLEISLKNVPGYASLTLATADVPGASRENISDFCGLKTGHMSLVGRYILGNHLHPCSFSAVAWHC
jgi:hypothetical protein